jgi:hypothetical protein
MSRKQRFIRRYGNHAAKVLKSNAKVARAGRSGDQVKIESERARHYALMANLP